MNEQTPRTVGLAFLAALTFVALLAFMTLKDETVIVNRPEQHEQVEVIGKRIKYNRIQGSRRSNKTYIVSFKFPDGSEKELQVGKINRSEIYDSMHKGDTGMLVYKERADIEKLKKEELQWAGRRFISFEKTSGGGVRLAASSLVFCTEKPAFLILSCVRRGGVRPTPRA